MNGLCDVVGEILDGFGDVFVPVVSRVAVVILDTPVVRASG